MLHVYVFMVVVFFPPTSLSSLLFVVEFPFFPGRVVFFTSLPKMPLGAILIAAFL
jgi:hypothetical protein